MGFPVAIVTSLACAGALVAVPMIKGVLVIVGAGWIAAAIAGFATGWSEGWSIVVNAVVLVLYGVLSMMYALRVSKVKVAEQPAIVPSVE